MRILRAAQRHGSGRSRAAPNQRCACCASAGPTLQSTMFARLREALPNARDLNEAFPAIPPGRVIRCANPSSASPEDVQYLLMELRVRDLIDLRAADEIQEDDRESALASCTLMRSYRRCWLRPGQLSFQDDVRCALSGPTPDAGKSSPYGASSLTNPATSADSRQATAASSSTLFSEPFAAAGSMASPVSSGHASEAVRAGTVPAIPSRSGTADTGESMILAVRHNISLLDRGRYYLSLAYRIPATTTAAAVLTNFVSKPAARSLLLPHVNGGGLRMLYEMLLESSRPEICQVLEVLLKAAESRHCAMFFCRAGKDRTGLVAAMVLAVAGASEEQVVEDYARSDDYHHVALAGLESREELAGLDRAQFERAPPEVMRATLDHIRHRYGSISDYLVSVGFGPDRQRRLRELLTQEW